MNKPDLDAVSRSLPQSAAFSNPSLRKLAGRIAVLCFLILLLAVVNGRATPSQPVPVASALPDYGARSEAGIETATGSLPSLDPAAQAGRAIEALVVVLCGVAGVVYLLKRAGLGSGTPPAKISLRSIFPTKASSGLESSSGPRLTVQQSQPLPGGGTLHVVTVADRTLLISASGQNISLLAEWEETDPDAQTSGEAA